MRLCPICGGHIRRTKWAIHQANHQYVMTRNLNREIPTRARNINAKIPSILIRNCRVDSCRTGIHLENVRGALVGGSRLGIRQDPSWMLAAEVTSSEDSEESGKTRDARYGRDALSFTRSFFSKARSRSHPSMIAFKPIFRMRNRTAVYPFSRSPFT